MFLWTENQKKKKTSKDYIAGCLKRKKIKQIKDGAQHFHITVLSENSRNEV